MPTTPSTTPKVLITGFGHFLTITTNPSYEIARRLPTTLTTANTTAQLIIANEIPSKYHEILDMTAQLIEEHAPDIVLHMGLARGQTYFGVEKGAQREGYHEVPDEGRRVFTRAENKKTFGKEAGRLESTLDLAAAAEAWMEEVRGVMLDLRGAAPGAGPGGAEEKAKEKGRGRLKKAEKESSFRGLVKGSQVDVRLSDDVGNYVCGFQYYVSLLEMQKRTGKRDTVFLHVPYLESLEEIQIGVRVTEGLIRALVGVWLDR